jgi:hypothetical protein
MFFIELIHDLIRDVLQRNIINLVGWDCADHLDALSVFRIIWSHLLPPFLGIHMTTARIRITEIMIASLIGPPFTM